MTRATTGVLLLLVLCALSHQAIATSCDTYCLQMSERCSGAYASLAACFEACAVFPKGNISDTEVLTGNSLACRLNHLQLALSDASFCIPAGRTGGDACKDFEDAVIAPEITVIANTLKLAASNILLHTSARNVTIEELIAMIELGDEAAASARSELSQHIDNLRGSINSTAVAAAADLNAAKMALSNDISTLATTLTGDATTENTIKHNAARITDVESDVEALLLNLTSTLESLAIHSDNLTDHSGSLALLDGAIAAETTRAVERENQIAGDLTTVTSTANAAKATSEANTGDLDDIFSCAQTGKIWNKNDGACISPAIAKDSTSPCNSASNGNLRFNPSLKRLEICIDNVWASTSPEPGTTQSFPAVDCLTIYNNGIRESGTYWLVGSGTTAFQAYCDMTTSGGGWTLIAMISDQNIDTWFYDSDLWWSDNTLNPDVTDLNANQHMKNLGYSKISFNSVRMVMGTYDLGHKHDFGSRFSDARQLFASTSVSTPYNRGDFMALMAKIGVGSGEFDNEPHCNIKAFNLEHCCDVTKCRYGISMNNENECNSNDAAIGFGCFTNNKSDGTRQVSAGGFRWNPTVRWNAKGWILVR